MAAGALMTMPAAASATSKKLWVESIGENSQIIFLAIGSWLMSNRFDSCPKFEQGKNITECLEGLNFVDVDEVTQTMCTSMSSYWRKRGMVPFFFLTWICYCSNYGRIFPIPTPQRFHNTTCLRK